MLQLTYSGIRNRAWKCLAALPLPLMKAKATGVELTFPDCAEPDLRYQLFLDWEVLDKLFVLRYNEGIEQPTPEGETTNVRTT